jgi:hypothetical protein
MIPVYGNDHVSAQATSTSLALSITPAAGWNRKVYILFASLQNPGAFGTLHYNGQELSDVGVQQTYGLFVNMWEYSIPDTDSGAKTIDIAWANNAVYRVVAWTFAYAGATTGVQYHSELGSVAIGNHTVNSDDDDCMIAAFASYNNISVDVYVTPSDTVISMDTGLAGGPNTGVGYRDADVTSTTMTGTRTGTTDNTVHTGYFFVIEADSLVHGGQVIIWSSQ